MSQAGQGVLCPGCRGVDHRDHGPYHETTERYDPGVMVDGSMLTLREPYRNWGWTSFPETTDLRGPALQCPWCGSSYSDHRGYIRLVVKPPDKEKEERRLAQSQLADRRAKASARKKEKQELADKIFMYLAERPHTTWAELNKKFPNPYANARKLRAAMEPLLKKKEGQNSDPNPGQVDAQ